MKHVEIAVDKLILYFVSENVYDQLNKRIAEEGKLVEVEDIKMQKDDWEWDERESSFCSMYKVWFVIKGYIWMIQIYIIFTLVLKPIC